MIEISVQSLSCVRLFSIPWTTACRASLSITNSLSLLKLMFIESVMSSNHLILCRPLLPLLSIFPSIRVFSNQSVLHVRWPKHWSFSFSISPSKEYSGLISFRMDWFAVRSLVQVNFSTRGKDKFGPRSFHHSVAGVLGQKAGTCVQDLDAQKRNILHLVVDDRLNEVKSEEPADINQIKARGPRLQNSWSRAGKVLRQHGVYEVEK